MTDYLRTIATQGSTWAGLAAICTAVGQWMSGDRAGSLSTLGTALGGLAAVLIPR